MREISHAGLESAGLRMSKEWVGMKHVWKWARSFHRALAVQRVILISAEARLQRAQVISTRNAVELLTLQMIKYLQKVQLYV